MRRLLVTAATTFALVSGGLIAVLPAQAASTFVVDADGMATSTDCTSSSPTPYTTIASAVADASDGDTIVVCPGTYDENITTGKSLTFQGAQAGVDARNRTSAAESIVDGGGGTAFTLSGDNTVLDGFTIQGATDNPGSPTPAVVFSGQGQVARNDIFPGNDAAAIIVGTDATFTQDHVTGGDGGYGFFFNSDQGSGSTVSDNAFDGNLSFSAINVADPGSPLNGMSITGNTADTSQSGNFAVLGGTRNVTISGNTVTGGASSGTGILFLGDDASYSVTGNTISGLNASAVSFAGGFGYPSNGGGTVSGNAFTNNLRGINVTEMDAAAKLTAERNILVGNTSGGTQSSPNAALRNTTASTVSAQNNYFGCQTGPNTTGCDATLNTGGGILDDDPWLVLSTSVGSSTLTQGGTTSFTADLNHNSDGTMISGTVLDGVLSASFAFSKGTAVPTNAPIVGGVATTTLTATGVGSGVASAMVTNSTSSKTVKITASKLPALTIHDAARAEGNSGTHPMKFRVSLNKTTTVPVTVQFTTVDGSAMAGSDYVAETGTLTIPPGQKVGIITVQIIGDKVKEPNELFAVNIYSPSNARIADPTASGTIRNDD